MKIRNGFVSNSSSSSFILGILNNAEDKCPHCGRGDTDIIGLMEKTDDGETTIDAIGYRDVLIELAESDNYVKYLNDVVAFHKENPHANIVFCRISYYNDELKSLLSENKNIKIIAQDE